jgi:hypothetical protein
LREELESAELWVDGSGRRVKAKAGYSAVTNVAEGPVDAVELLLQAAAALRHVRTVPAHALLSGFDEIPMRLVD